MKTKIVIAGGSGSLGGALIQNFSSSDYEIVILSRTLYPSKNNVRYVQWDALNQGEWTKEIEHCLVLINLVGKSVNCRYTEKNKKEITASRVNSTLALGEAIKDSSYPPKLWINAGSAAIFGNAGDSFKIETDPVGHGFSPEVCIAWENAFYKMVTPKTRKVFLRIGMVLQQEGGVLKPMKNVVKTGFGGRIGSGNQYMTWIHELDFLNMINWIIEKEYISGIIHCASPNPVTNQEFMKTLRVAMKFPFGLPTPALVLKAGAVIIGTEPELILSGRRVVSEVLKKNNFQFKFPRIKDALIDIFKS